MSTLELFQKGDVFLDYPYEEIKFRFDKATNKVFARRYGKPEVEIKHSNSHFNEAISAGRVITQAQYFADGDG
jgi:hypothetical protein